jgi:prolyl 4-hydroxylase
MQPDFIFLSKNAVDQQICKNIINFFEKSDNIEPGKIGSGVYPKIKKSTDLTLSFKDNYSFIFSLHSLVHQNCKKYNEKYEILSTLSPWSLSNKFNIQRYLPNEGYFVPHSEHGPTGYMSKRILAWMIYLNDVYDGGETYFTFQRKKFKPREGDMLIWPAGFTHTHHGIISKKETKYILTGWFEYE